MKSRLTEIVIKSESKEGRLFDAFIQIVIIISLISFSIETLPNLTDSTKQLLAVLEHICIIIFTIEYLLRLWLTSKSSRYVFSFYGIIDLMAIVPYYLTFGIDLRALRSVRLLRIFRVFKLLQYNKAIGRLTDAFYKVKSELIIFSVTTLIFIYISSIGIYYFENPVQPEQFASVFDCMWWSLITLTSVGYGDIYPITTGGKVFASLTIITGMGVIAIPTGLIASALTNTLNQNE